MIRVLRWSVPVDSQVHEIGGGKLVHVATKDDPAVVAVWTIEPDDHADRMPERLVEVFGTGEALGNRALNHLGSTIAGEFVWHLFEVSA